MPIEREWAEAFRRLDSGISSYEAEAKRLGVGKGTVYRHHIAELQRKINMKKSEFNRIMIELTKASQKLRELEKEKKKLEDEIHQARGKLSTTIQELNRALSTYERLKRVGVAKLSSLAEFVGSYEALGFSAQQVQKLAAWRQSLAEMGLDPDKLEDFIKKKGSLESQISELEKERKRVESILKKLKDEHRQLFEETLSLQAETLKLRKLSKVLKLNMIVITCKICGREGVLVKLRTASEYISMMRSGAALQYKCIYCGRWAMYTPWEIVTAIGLLALPELKVAK